jgi:hypothetical protein
MGEMMLRRIVALAIAVGVLDTAAAQGQSLTTEASVTAGASMDDVSALATQLRAFGDATPRIRYYVETAWARTDNEDSDAFGAAYPYRSRPQVIEAYGEWLGEGTRVLSAVRVGRYRTPFGISSGSDHAYNGFLRAPLIRYDGYWALSNNFLEHGVDVLVGPPPFTVEASVGAPADVGEAVRRPSIARVIRAQSAIGSAVIGVSHMRTPTYGPAAYAHGDLVFTGLDVRWMYEGVQVRGEWIAGRPWDGTATTGWYADVIAHPRVMGPVTAVARIEQLDYDAGAFSRFCKRQTIGARIRVLDGLSAQVNLLHNSSLLYQPRRTTMDVGVTYSIRH